jgi:protein-arginine kinase activator protein McsA
MVAVTLTCENCHQDTETDIPEELIDELQDGLVCYLCTTCTEQYREMYNLDKSPIVECAGGCGRELSASNGYFDAWGDDPDVFCLDCDSTRRRMNLGYSEYAKLCEVMRLNVQ